MPISEEGVVQRTKYIMQPPVAKGDADAMYNTLEWLDDGRELEALCGKRMDALFRIVALKRICALS